MTANDLANSDQEIEAINRRLQTLEEEKSQLLSRKAALKSTASDLIATSSSLAPKDKVVLFQKFFIGRDDIHAFRWENNAGKSGYAVACHNEWKRGLCNKPKIKCGDCTNKAYKALEPKIIYDHLSGTQTVGLYPLMRDDSCQLLAVDFDKSDWQQAVKAFSHVCSDYKIPHAIERSRSGNGAHIWVFFENKVQARDSRRLGFGLLDRAMENYPGLSFDSYDRLFPNQDSLPNGGFGNLIALPLQHQPRQYGNFVFVNQELVAYQDQWHFLSGLTQLSLHKLHDILQVFDGGSPEPAVKPWEQGIPATRGKIDNCPARLNIVLANQIFVPVNTLPSKLLARLKRQASFANPVFFKTQAMRFSTHGIPRYVSLARIEQEYLVVPRGCLDDIVKLLGDQNVAVDIDDKRAAGNKLKGIRFLGELRGDQKQAVKKLTAHDVGILHAPTAFGKTVTAIGVIAKRKVNTLILTHTRQLVDQWKERLSADNLLLEGVKPHIADVYRWLMESEVRNKLIVKDVAAEVDKGANPLVLTERREHTELISQALSDQGYETVVLRGAMGAKERKQAMEKAKTTQVLIATGKYIGEGFDLPRLDTLFLALPISWKGSLAQYAGRIHRTADGKKKVAIYDYVDSALPMLQRMFQRRCKGYEAMGYRFVGDGEAPSVQSQLAV